MIHLVSLAGLEKYCVYEMRGEEYVDRLGNVEKGRNPDLTDLLYARKELFQEVLIALHNEGIKRFCLNMNHVNACAFLQGVKNIQKIEKAEPEKRTCLGNYVDFEFIS